MPTTESPVRMSGPDQAALVADEAMLSVLLTAGEVGLTAEWHLLRALTVLAQLLGPQLPALPACPAPGDVPVVLQQIGDRLFVLRHRVPRRYLFPLAWAARWVDLARLAADGLPTPPR